jgi:hypothetical protein
MKKIILGTVIAVVSVASFQIFAKHMGTYKCTYKIINGEVAEVRCCNSDGECR